MSNIINNNNNNLEDKTTTKLFFQIINNIYIFKNYVATHLHHNHDLYTCKVKAKNLDYPNFLVNNQLLDQLEYGFRFTQIRYWSQLSLEYLLSQQHKYDLKTFERFIDINSKRLAITPQVIAAAIKYSPTKSFELLKLLARLFPVSISSNAYETAATYGRLDIIRYLIANFPDISIGRFAANYAAKSNQLETLIFLDQYEKHLLPSEAIFMGADEKMSNSRVLPTIIFTSQAIDQAVSKAENIDCIRYLMENRTEGCTHMAIDSAASYGHIEIVKLIRQFYPKWDCTINASYYAAENGHIDMILYLHSQNLIDMSIAMFRSFKHPLTAAVKHPEIFRYLVDVVKLPINNYLNLDAAIKSTEGDQLELFKFITHDSRKSQFKTYLKENVNKLIDVAGAHSQPIFKFIDKNIKSVKSIKPPYYFIVNAIHHQNIPMLEYLLSEKMKWIRPHFPKSIILPKTDQYDRLMEMFLLFDKHGIKFKELTNYERVTLPVFKYLEKTFPMDRSNSFHTEAACGAGFMDLAHYLFESGYTFSENAVYRAIMNGQRDMLRYLLDNTLARGYSNFGIITDKDNHKLLDAAISSKNYKMVKYIVESIPNIIPSPNGIDCLIHSSIAILDYIVEKFYDKVFFKVMINPYRCTEDAYDFIYAICKRCPNWFILNYTAFAQVLEKSALGIVMLLLDTYQPEISLHTLLRVKSVEIFKYIAENSTKIEITDQMKTTLIENAYNHQNYHLSDFITKYSFKNKV